MAAKVIFVLCASALVIQSALGQCLGRMTALQSPISPSRTGFGLDGFGFDNPAMEGIWARRSGCSSIIPAPELAASCGGGLSISSSSAAAPTGLAVTSENVYEGPVAVTGNLPFLGTAAMDGVFSTGGTGAINYGCGDGAVAITAESPVDSTVGTPAIASAAIAPTIVATAASSSAAINSPITPWGFKGFQSRGCGWGAPSL